MASFPTHTVVKKIWLLEFGSSKLRWLGDLFCLHSLMTDINYYMNVSQTCNPTWPIIRIVPLALPHEMACANHARGIPQHELSNPFDCAPKSHYLPPHTKELRGAEKLNNSLKAQAWQLKHAVASTGLMCLDRWECGTLRKWLLAGGAELLEGWGETQWS